MTKKYRKTLRGLALALSAVLLLAMALAGCDSGLNDPGTSGGGGAGGGGTNPGSGTDESPLWNKPDVKKLYGIFGVARGDDEQKYLVKAVDAQWSKGTGAGTVGVDAFHDTNRYRIPSATVIPGGKYAGRLLVISDSRFGHRGDLPAKASTWVRYSDDHGNTWSNIATVSDFDDTDMSGARSGMDRMSVSTGDSAIGADSNGYVYSISTFVAPMTGNTFEGTSNQAGSPYVYIGGEWYLRLRKNTELYNDGSDWDEGTFTEKGIWTPYTSETYAGNDAVYVYAAPVKGGQLRKLNGNNNTPSLGDHIPVWIDEYYYLYKDAGLSQKLTASQLKTSGGEGKNPDDWSKWKENNVTISINSATPVHQHLFMPMSPYQVWRGGTFLGMTRSKDGGQTWEKTKDITYMTNKFIAANTSNKNLNNNLTRQFVCPTRGFELQNGSRKGTVVFAIYMVGSESLASGSEAASFVWTQDGGETWTAASSFTGGTSSEYKGETAIVEAPDGDIILVSRNVRNGKDRPTYSVSTNFGSSWTNKGKVWTGQDKNTHPLYSSGNLISAINLRFTKSILGNSLVAFSTDNGGGNDDAGRKDGHLWLASLVEDDDGWKFDFNCDLAGSPIGMKYGYPSGGSASFHYSSVVETFDGNIFSAYEGSAWAGPGGEHGGPVIDYAHFTLNRK